MVYVPFFVLNTGEDTDQRNYQIISHQLQKDIVQRTVESTCPQDISKGFGLTDKSEMRSLEVLVCPHIVPLLSTGENFHQIKYLTKWSAGDKMSQSKQILKKFLRLSERSGLGSLVALVCHHVVACVYFLWWELGKEAEHEGKAT